MNEWDFFRLDPGCRLTWTKVGFPYLRFACIVPVLFCCPTVISDSVLFYSQKCLGLDDKLQGHPHQVT